MWRHANGIAKCAREVEPAHHRYRRQVIERDIIRKMRLDIVERPQNTRLCRRRIACRLARETRELRCECDSQSVAIQPRRGISCSVKADGELSHQRIDRT